MDLVLTGSVAYDYLMTFPGLFKDHFLPDKLDSISLSFLVDSMVRRRGGISPNIAYTLALLGGHPRVMATVGEDFTEYRATLESVGVDTSLMKVIPDEFTASFFANTDQSNSQIASFYPGAMDRAGELSFHDLEHKPDLVVISPNAPDAMVQYPEECQELGIPYLYDPSQQIPRMTGEDLRLGVEGSFALMVNDYEIELIKKHTGMSKSEIREGRHFVVVTRGEAGASIYTDGEEIRTPIVSPEIIADPTGVGDAFRGGFLTGYSHGLDWEICGKIGALAATYCLESTGTQEHIYTPEEFVARFREHFDDGGTLDILVK
ncbi:MAG: carbohydrate kinase family protein [Anaerolineales bacterium]|nr:carbohydrate kinase family protein [Anaerolineales bacterium]